MGPRASWITQCQPKRHACRPATSQRASDGSASPHERRARLKHRAHRTSLSPFRARIAPCRHRSARPSFSAARSARRARGAPAPQRGVRAAPGAGGNQRPLQLACFALERRRAAAPGAAWRLRLRRGRRLRAASMARGGSPWRGTHLLAGQAAAHLWRRLRGQFWKPWLPLLQFSSRVAQSPGEPLDSRPILKTMGAPEPRPRCALATTALRRASPLI